MHYFYKLLTLKEPNIGITSHYINIDTVIYCLTMIKFGFYEQLLSGLKQ